MADNTEQNIIVFLEENKPAGVAVDRIEMDTDLIGSGVIDSFGVVAFIEFLEDTYGIEVSDDDIDPENFRTVVRIVDYIQRERRNGQ